jgi:hypothetical protein
LKLTKVAPMFRPLFSKVMAMPLILTKIDWATIWAIFFTNLSGHPRFSWKKKTWKKRRKKERLKKRDWKKAEVRRGNGFDGERDNPLIGRRVDPPIPESNWPRYEVRLRTQPLLVN